MSATRQYEMAICDDGFGFSEDILELRFELFVHCSTSIDVGHDGCVVFFEFATTAKVATDN